MTDRNLAAAPSPGIGAERCSVQAGLRGDPMLGTAFPAGRLFLVEQPGPWGRAGLAESRFDRAVAHRLIEALAGVPVRVIAIRRPGRTVVDGPRRWAAVDCRPGRERLVWGTFDGDAELLSIDVAAVLDDGSADTAPLFAVCAHGTHDVCCAMRGRPVAAALEAVRPGRVWECSHVGGDRFAANVLVLPFGVLYGRVVESAATAVADAADRGTVVEHHLRGRVGFPPTVQAAMAQAHREVPGLTLDDVRLLGTSRLSADLTAVRLRVDGVPMDVRVSVERSARDWLTCQASEPSTAAVYLPQALTPGV